MAYEPELLIAAGSLTQIEQYISAGATAVLIGESRFGMRQPADIESAQLKEAVQLAHRLGAKAYVNMNKLFRNEELEAIPAYLMTVADAGADAVVFSDAAVLLNLRQYAPTLNWHWNAEMTGTNSSTADYWGKRGASRAVLARELNEEELIDIKQRVDMEIQVQVHGMTNIYHSYRNLLESYLVHLGKEATLIRKGPDRHLYLMEAERPDERYPVYEDTGGTHVMSPDDYCLLEAMPTLLEAGIESFYVEGLLKTDTYNVTVLQSYRRAIETWLSNPQQYQMDSEWLSAIEKLQPPERELSFGFLYKEQVY